MKTLLSIVVVTAAFGLSIGSAVIEDGAEVKPDFTMIEKLPAREILAKKAFHQQADSGNTGAMRSAMNTYNETLTTMVGELATAYYIKSKVTKEEVAAYAKTLRTAAEFRHRLDNPSNEDRGSLDTLEVPSAVSDDLENTVEQMVEAITDDADHFDHAKWVKQWEEAKKTGDETVPDGKVEEGAGDRSGNPDKAK